MNVSEFYAQRLTSLRSEKKLLAKKKSAFAWLRLGAVLGIFVVFYLLWNVGVGYFIAGSIFFAAIFLWLVSLDLSTHQKLQYIIRLIEINENELKYMEGNFYDAPAGDSFLSKDHPYANDLDIFGRASLYQYINRTTSEPGAILLAEFFKEPTPFREIFPRQSAIKELSQDVKWIQELQANGMKEPITTQTVDKLLSWLEAPLVFSKFKPWMWLRYLLPFIAIASVVAFIYDFITYPTFLWVLFFLAIIAYQINKYVAPLHSQLTKVAAEFNALSNNLKLIESRKFESALLTGLQRQLGSKHATSFGEIKLLSKILSRLDLRYNLVLSPPLNLLLMWNLQQALDLEKWKMQHQNNISKWINVYARFEALGSFAVLAFNEPGWVYPTIREQYFSIEGKEVGHPLINKLKRVNNDIDIPDNDHLMLVTGSNMAGKSTYLRSVGVNTVLALAGAPVCAKAFSVSYVKLLSSMRVTDNLEESTSTFYAELKKLKTIIDAVNAGENVFILLDEILRGTNSIDRHTGSKALIKQLMKENAAAIIATHDLELAKDPSNYEGHLLNYHFDVQVSGEKLFFDYKLKPGICTSLNASLLMKQIGIDV